MRRKAEARRHQAAEEPRGMRRAGEAAVAGMGNGIRYLGLEAACGHGGMEREIIYAPFPGS
jgi:hypothetical protein